MKKTSVIHSTSSRYSRGWVRETATSAPAPSSATREGSMSSAPWAMKPTITRDSTIPHWISSRLSLMTSRSSSCITRAARFSS